MRRRIVIGAFPAFAGCGGGDDRPTPPEKDIAEWYPVQTKHQGRELEIYAGFGGCPTPRLSIAVQETNSAVRIEPTTPRSDEPAQCAVLNTARRTIKLVRPLDGRALVGPGKRAGRPGDAVRFFSRSLRPEEPALKRLVVPNVIGMRSDDALLTLCRARFRAPTNFRPRPPKTVIDQDPAAGRTLPVPARRNPPGPPTYTDPACNERPTDGSVVRLTIGP